MTTDHDEIYEGRVARDEKNYPAMTHDELLAKVEHYNYMEAGDLIKALRAVVGLHRPSHQIPQVKQTEGCVACGYDIVHSTWEENWPCPTIQAIEREIG